MRRLELIGLTSDSHYANFSAGNDESFFKAVSVSRDRTGTELTSGVLVI